MSEDQTVYRTEVRFNAIYVVESLPPGDLKTGRALYDDIIYPATIQLAGVHTQFISAPSHDAFIQALATVGRAVRLSHHLPILHLETHGSTDGVALGDGTHITWRDLVPILGDINQASRMNLMVIAMSCMGLNLLYSLMPSDRAPVFMLIGPPDTMTAGDILQATRRFYTSMASRLDLNAALESMNAHAEYSDWKLKPATAEILFCRVFRQYLKESGTFDRSEERVDAIVAEVARAQGLSADDTPLLRESVRRALASNSWWYEELRHTFLMMDLFPETTDRFGLTYSRCFPNAEG